MASTAKLARKWAYEVIDAYSKRFPKAVQCLENSLEDSLTFYIPEAGRLEDFVF